MTARLDKLVANGCLVSRSDARAAILAGRVLVNGQPCRDPARKVETDATVLLDGAPVSTEPYIYLMLNKPAGVLSATEDSAMETALDLLPDRYRKAKLGVVGRLDRDAEGLLLLTNDGELNHRLTSPKHHVDKLYRVWLDRPADREDVSAFAGGIELSDFTCLPASLELVSFGQAEHAGQECLVTIREGKFHQIKRMFGSRGKRVERLKRLRIGPLCLDETLAPGAWRPLFGEEVAALQTAANCNADKKDRDF